MGLPQGTGPNIRSINKESILKIRKDHSHRFQSLKFTHISSHRIGSRRKQEEPPFSSHLFFLIKERGVWIHAAVIPVWFLHYPKGFKQFNFCFSSSIRSLVVSFNVYCQLLLQFHFRCCQIVHFVFGFYFGDISLPIFYEMDFLVQVVIDLVIFIVMALMRLVSALFVFSRRQIQVLLRRVA